MPTGYLWAKISTLLSERFRNLPVASLQLIGHDIELVLLTAFILANPK
jgi:hypothetical protein